MCMEGESKKAGSETKMSQANEIKYFLEACNKYASCTSCNFGSCKEYMSKSCKRTYLIQYYKFIHHMRE